MALVTFLSRQKTPSSLGVSSCFFYPGLYLADLFRPDQRLSALQNELLKEARTIVEERRSSVVLGIKGEANREGVFQWVDGPPTAGKPARLAYNANSGQLRNAQVCFSPSQHELLPLAFHCGGISRSL